MLVAALISAVVLAQAHKVDQSPTAWSCTVETLRSGKDCVFETEARPSSDVHGQATQNVAFAKRLVDTLCATAAKPSGAPKADPSLQQLCRTELEPQVELCAAEGERPLVDAKGRFSEAGRPCYLALREGLSKVVTMAEVASACCQCVAKERCPSAGDACYRDLIRASPASGALACMTGRCLSACGDVLPSPPKANEDDGLVQEPFPLKRPPSKNQGASHQL